MNEKINKLLFKVLISIFVEFSSKCNLFDIYKCSGHCRFGGRTVNNCNIWIYCIREFVFSSFLRSSTVVVVRANGIRIYKTWIFFICLCYTNYFIGTMFRFSSILLSKPTFASFFFFFFVFMLTVKAK